MSGYLCSWHRSLRDGGERGGEGGGRGMGEMARHRHNSIQINSGHTYAPLPGFETATSHLCVQGNPINGARTAHRVLIKRLFLFPRS